MTLLKNNHIRLRALEPEDLDALYKWENDTSIWSAGSTVSPYSRYVLKEYISQSHLNIYEVKQLRLMIEALASQTAIGIVDLYDFDLHNRKAGVGILVDPTFRGNGLATEALLLLKAYAFSYLKLHQLFAYIATDNQPSQTLFARCGFTTTGTLKDWISTEDGFVDVQIMQAINR